MCFYLLPGIDKSLWLELNLWVYLVLLNSTIRIKHLLKGTRVAALNNIMTNINLTVPSPD